MRVQDQQVLNLRPGAQVRVEGTPKPLQGVSKSSVEAVSEELAELHYVPDEVIVGMRSSRSGSSITLQELLGARQVESFPGETPAVRLKLSPESDLATVLAFLREHPDTEYAEANQILYLDQFDPRESVQEFPLESTIPNDLHPDLWGLDNKENPGADISASEAWKKTTGSNSGPLIAVIDSGADYQHPDLRPNLAVNEGEIPGDGKDNDGNGVVDDVYGFNAFEATGDPMDGLGHGTHCTGTIAAVGNNGRGVVGVNWKANVLPVKIFHDRGLTTTDSILRGLEYARDRGAVITSNSWGGPAYSQAIHDAFAGFPALHIAASGNSGENTDQKASYPANYGLPNMVSVGASNSSDQSSWFSNFGRETVDLFAPGEDILSTVPGGKYEKKSGTSMATPHVTGSAGLVAHYFNNTEASFLKDKLLFSTDPLNSVAELSVTGGRLNAAAALSNDRVPPAAPNDFWVTETTPTTARFSWTVSGDDGWKNGPASSFEVRVSSAPIDEGNWDGASPLSTQRGLETGQHLHAHFKQTPREEPTTLFAAFKAVDEAGNRSEPLTAKAVLPAADTIFRDTFDDEGTAWKGEGRWRLVPEGGRGKVWSSKSGEGKGAFSELISPSIALGENSFLRFESRQDFAWSNNVFVEIGTDGETWDRLDTLEDRGEWREREYDLSKYDGQSVQFRIRSENLGAREGDGMMLDNFVILGPTT